MRPIVLGGDIGAYASARAFHEAFGVRSVVVAGAATGPVRDSVAVDLRVVPDVAADLVATLGAIVAERPGERHLVLASADWLVEAVVAAAPQLRDLGVVVPYAPADVVARASDKAQVMAACAALGVPHPETAVLVLDGEARLDAVLAPLAELTYPRVVKVASTSRAHDVTYPGQAKVHVVADAAEARDLLGRMAAAGLRGGVLVQEVLPGGDGAMAAANVFVGPDGEVRFAQLGRVLLEEHTPTALGNSLAQVTADARTDALAPAVLADVQRLLRHLGWSGFANVDLMQDAAGTYRVLEINPRVGRSGYAVTASGYNVAAMYVDAYLDGAPAPAAPVLGAREHLFTVVPTALLRVFAPQARAQVRRLRRARAVTNVLVYRAERSPRRWWYVTVAAVNQARKLLRYHPASPLAGRR
ncbi:carboxylate--amine ligase [Miniimonas arenae]|uniref:Carboxylate--amine ligase n=1 Tax=Miniimonas arenae TaxID=676201 RepID=A0A5C5BCS9_9MICO|nr:carboxylate--amine ligase [Miniimonas arenae]TNU76075.1 carboxylate--amine ligase [Miniimonas arenae]